MESTFHKRSALTYLAIAYLAMAFLIVAVTVAATYIFGFAAAFFAALGAGPLALLFVLMAIPFVGAVALNIALYIGTTRRRPWAWKVGVNTEGVTLLATILLTISGNVPLSNPWALVALILIVCLAGAILIMLHIPEVHRALGNPQIFERGS